MTRLPHFFSSIFSKDAGGGFGKPDNGQITEPTSDGLIYMPDTDFCGYDSFVYEITSGDLSDSATVTVHILCDGDTASPTAMSSESSPAVVVTPAAAILSITPRTSIMPEAVAIEERTTMESPVSIPLEDLFDLDFTEVRITYVPANGGVLVAGDGNSLLYTPGPGFEGSEVLAYSLCTTVEPVVCDVSTITIVVIGSSETAPTSNMDESPIVDSDPEHGLSFTPEALSEESEEDSQHETLRTSSIIGAAVGAALALAGTWAFVSKRRKGSDGQNFDKSGLWLKTVYSADNTEASSLTSELANKTGHHHRSSREIQFAGSSNLSVTAFLSGEAGSPEAPKSKKTFFRDKHSTPEMAPLSPANSLFSVGSSTSKTSYVVEDVVDL